MRNRIPSHVLTWVILLSGGWRYIDPPASCEMITPRERVLLVGDSWAQVMWLAKSLRTTLDELGYGDVLEKGDVTALGGTRADQWKKLEKLTLITSELASHPSIDLVHISLGGNDFFTKWKTSLSPEQETQVLTGIANDLNVLIQHTLSQREDVSVLICGYTYLNFEETRQAGLVPWCAESGGSAIWPIQGMPTPLQANTGLARLEAHKAALAEGDSRVSFVNNLGLMQYWFGYPSKGIAPRTVPLPEGNPELPSPPEALNNGLDCAHLSPEGYLVLARNCVKEFYGPRMSPEGRKYSFSSLPAGEGTVWSASGGVAGIAHVTGELKVGDLTTNGISKALLSFDTSGLPDHVTPTAARLFLTRSQATGTNPLGGNLPQGQPVCDVLQPVPGESGLHEGDWEREPSAGNAGRFAGSLKEDGWKIRIDLKEEALSALNRTGETLFRLGFTRTDGNSVDDQIVFAGVDEPDPEKRPVLEVFLEEAETPSCVGTPTMAVE